VYRQKQVELQSKRDRATDKQIDRQDRQIYRHDVYRPPLQVVLPILMICRWKRNNSQEEEQISINPKP
jgi:hypothetical protein